MDGDKRRSQRQALKYPAKIDIGSGMQVPCLLSDVSASGARLTLQSPGDIPEQFALLLAAEHGVQRECKVMWREENQLGVEFIKPLAVKDAHSPFPKAPPPGA